jgi:integrase
MQTQAKTQAKKAKIEGISPDGVSIWSYKTKKGTRWAFEVRYKTSEGVIKRQIRGFVSKPACLKAISESGASSHSSTNRNASQSFKELIETYISDLVSKVSESTRANYLHLLLLYTPYELLIKEPSAISNKEIEVVLAELTGKGVRAGTVNTYRSRLSATFNFGIRNGACKGNPVASVRRARPSSNLSSAVSEPWSVSEVRQALTALVGHRLELFIHLAIFAGLRKGEILALTWRDIDFENSTLRVNKSLSQRRYLDGTRIRTRESIGETKTSSSVRVIPLSGTTLNLLSSHRSNFDANAEHHLCSRSKGQPYPISTLGKDFKRFCFEEGIRQIRIHDLRHTSAVLSLMGNAPLEAVSEALGHSSVEVTKRFYAKRVSTFPSLFVSGVHEALKFKESKND